MFYFRFLFIFALFCKSIFANNDFAVIVSKSSSIKEISKKDISKIFLAKTKRLPNGKKAITVEPSQTEIKKFFYKQISGKSLKQLKRYWATMIFTGKGKPPKKMKSSEEIINFVKYNKNAIAYIPKKDAEHSDIKVVMEIR